MLSLTGFVRACSDGWRERARRHFRGGNWEPCGRDVESGTGVDGPTGRVHITASFL